MNLQYITREFCTGCGCADPKFWAFPHISKHSIHLQSACYACAMVDAAIEEADSLELRYTYISVGPIDGDYYNGSRCPCGAVGLTNLSSIRCVRCWKEERMLGKRVAEHKFLSRLLVDLRREVKESKKREMQLT